MKSKILYIILSIIIFIFLILYFNNYYINYILDKYSNKSDTVWVTKIDTLKEIKDTTIYKTVPKYIEKLKTDTFYTKDGKDTVLSIENKVYQDTLTCANDSIILQSFITGINSRRDSIKANWKRQETIVTNYVEITKYIDKKKTFWDKFHIGFQAGYGYGFKSKELTPYVGFGGSIDL